MSTVTDFYRGSTFDYSGEVSITDGGVALTDLTGWTGQSQIRAKRGAQAGTVVATLEFTWLDASARLCRIRSTSSTDAWLLGRAIVNIQLASPAGDKVATQNYELDIVEGATHA